MDTKGLVNALDIAGRQMVREFTGSLSPTDTPFSRRRGTSSPISENARGKMALSPINHGHLCSDTQKLRR